MRRTKRESNLSLVVYEHHRLTDSPWCIDRETNRSSLIERYLCRSNEHVNFWPEPQSKFLPCNIHTLFTGFSENAQLCISQNDDLGCELFVANNDGVSTTTLAIVGVVSGLVLLFMACLVAYFLYRIRRRTRELHQIQEG